MKIVCSNDEIDTKNLRNEKLYVKCVTVFEGTMIISFDNQPWVLALKLSEGSGQFAGSSFSLNPNINVSINCLKTALVPNLHEKEVLAIGYNKKNFFENKIM